MSSRQRIEQLMQPQLVRKQRHTAAGAAAGEGPYCIACTGWVQLAVQADTPTTASIGLLLQNLCTSLWLQPHLLFGTAAGAAAGGGGA